MFKNITVLKHNIGILTDGEFQYMQFSPCGGQQERSLGWVPPRGPEHGALVEFVDGEAMLHLRIETKTVPASVVKRKLDEWADQVEAQTGRKPGKKERRDQSEDIHMALLPNAFSKVVDIPVWLDRKNMLVIIGTTSQARVDDVFTMLLQCKPDAVFQQVQFGTSPESLMTMWLRDQDEMDTDERYGFDIDRECELKAYDETNAVVRYSKHNLDIKEIEGHIKQGKQATHLALTYKDRVSFVLTSVGQLRKINILDVAFEEAGQGEDAFDSDVAIFTGEIRPLLEDLHAVLNVQEESEDEL